MKSVVYTYTHKKSAGLHDPFGSGSLWDIYFFSKHISENG